MRKRGKRASVSVALAITVPLIPCLAYLTSGPPPVHRYPRPVAPSSRQAQAKQAPSELLEWPVLHVERPPHSPALLTPAPNPGQR
jgi:hypothetical protein